MTDFLEMAAITKRFGDHAVLNEIRFSANRGEVHALIGENGAGKSTLMKILSGVVNPDSGEIRIDGQPVRIANPKQAQENGVAMIYQDIRLFPDLNIAENVFIRREPVKKWLRTIDWEQAYRETTRYLERFGLDFHSKAIIKSLSAGQQKFVEIIKALSQKANILIMDEPTAALTEQEIEVLFNAIREIKKLGVAVIYISHRIGEIGQIADRVTVLRDGEVVRSCGIDEVETEDLIRVMVGKDLKDRYPKLNVKIGKEMLRVDNLRLDGRLRNINFNVKKGEIVGLTGLSGSGRRTLAKTLVGINGSFEGTIHINGKSFHSITPHTAKSNGLCYVSGVVNEEGLIANTSIAENITLANLERVAKGGFIRNDMEASVARDMISRLEIGADEKDRVDHLSGGMQKKVILGKWLFSGAQMLIIDEPTAGIDIGSKIDIYNIINELVMSGASVLMISSDLSEMMGMCDRIMVMYDGEIRKIFNRDEVSQEKMLYYASGGEVTDR